MLNTKIFFFLYNLTHQSASFDSLVIFFAKYFPYLVILFAIIFLLFHHEVIKSNNPFKALSKKWKEFVLVFFSGISAWVIANIIKIIIQAPRPFLVFPDIVPLLQKTDFSFPSGHATFFSALAVSLFFSHKKAGYLFIFFALLIGVARIIVGVHFPIDILGGYLVGILTAYFIRFISNKI